MKTIEYSFENIELEEDETIESFIKSLPIGQYDNRVLLGHVIKVPGEYDEDGNELTAPVYSDGYKVDVLWRNGKQLKEWKPFQIKEEINNIVHKFT